MANLDYESNRQACGFVAVVALICCAVSGSWLAFAVLCVATAEYIATMFCEMLAERKK